MIRVTSLLRQIHPQFRNLMSMTTQSPSSMNMWDSSVARRVSIISWIQCLSELVNSTIQRSVQRVQATTTRQLAASTKKYARAWYCIPSPTHSFFPGLKPSLSANPSHCSPSFLVLKYSLGLRGFRGLFAFISEHICFLLLVFFLFLHFLVVGFRAVD